MTFLLAVSCDRRWAEHRCAARFTRTDVDAADLERAARTAGWHTSPDGDYCPNHAKEDR